MEFDANTMINGLTLAYFVWASRSINALLKDSQLTGWRLKSLEEKAKTA